MARSFAGKILSFEGAAGWRDSLDLQGKRVVFTNGCFDLLHAGHVRYLAEARALGDALVVGLNADVSVQQLKGPGRPINAEADRAEVISALRSVDAVVVFGEQRATKLIRALRPHVYAKGGDYTVESLNPEERNVLMDCGSEIRILPLVAGKSTTQMLSHAEELEAEESDRPIRLGVLGSGRGTNLLGLLASIGSGTLNAEVRLVLSDVEQSGILELAESHGLNTAFVDPGAHPWRLQESAQKEIVDRLRAAQVDLVALSGFMRILKDPILRAFPGRILNTHPSLLPKYPGRDAWKQALTAGEKETGCSVHLVDAGIDTGPILKQRAVPIVAGDTAQELHQRIQVAENRIYPQAIAELWNQLRA